MAGERTATRGIIAQSRPAGWAALRRLAAEHWPLAVAIALVAVAGVPSLNFQYGPDQALFMYAGKALLRGQTLYVDVWDVKPPGVFWVYALAGWLPAGARGLRAFDLVFALASVTAVYLLGRHLWDRAAGAVAGLLYGLLYVTTSGYWNMAQPDSFMVLPVVLGVLAWDRGLPGSAVRTALFCGLLFGLAFQFRSVVALLPAALVAWELCRQDRRQSIKRTLWLAGGFAAVQALTLGYLAAGGAAGEYLFAQFRFARHYAALGGPYAFDGFDRDNYLTGLRGSVMWYTVSRLLVSAPALAAVFFGGLVRADRGVRLMSLLLLVAVAGVAVQAKFFVYHWHVAVPFLALLAAWTAVQTWTLLRQRYHRRWAALASGAGVLGLLAFTPMVTDGGLGEWRDLVRYVREPAYRPVYFDRFGLRNHGTYSFSASEEAANYVRARTTTNDLTFVWGYDPNFYLISGRDSASRFLSFLPLMPVFTPEEWKQEFVRDLETKRPAYILIQQGENARWITGRTEDSAAWVRQFSAFHALIERDYVFDLRIEDYAIYRRR